MRTSDSPARSPSSSPARSATERHDIIHLSATQNVSMGEYWFDIVSMEHFWMIRRFEVLRKIAGPLLDPNLSHGEIGCGTGLLQRQLEEKAGLKVDGYDLGLAALRQNESRRGALFYYNVSDQKPELKEKYDVLFLFDVLEHVERDLSFLQACLFHLKPGGSLIVNVPARMELFSKYDEVVGHVRRYSIPQLVKLAETAGAPVNRATYWGVPFYPLLILRKFLVRRLDSSQVLQGGMRPPNRWVNLLFKMISRLEIIPQRLIGTSILVVMKKPSLTIHS